MQSSSLDTMASDVFDQDKSPLCWIYSGVNLMLKFIIQTYKTYDKNKNIFEEKGKDMTGENFQYYTNFFSIRDNICSEKILNEDSGNFKRRLLFVYLFGIVLQESFTEEELTQYSKMTFAKKRKFQEEVFLNGAGGWGIRAAHRLCVFLNNEKFSTPSIITLVMTDYCLIKNTACIRHIIEIIQTFHSYNVKHKLAPHVRRATNLSNKEKESLIIDALNQNVYFNIALDYFKEDNCVRCGTLAKLSNEEHPNDAFQQEYTEGFGHEMTCVGYSKKDKAIIIKNTWSRAWCQTGFFLLKSLYCVNNLKDIYMIDSNLPRYKYLPKNYNLFTYRFSGELSDSLTPSSHSKVQNEKHIRPTVVNHFANMSLKYRSYNDVKNRLDNSPLYHVKRNLLKNRTVIAKTKKRCPAGYKVMKNATTLCIKKNI